LSPASTGSRGGRNRPHEEASRVVPSVNRSRKEEAFGSHSNYYDDHDLPPPYDEVTNKYKKDEYPKDEKTRKSSDSGSSGSSLNPFPASSVPKQSHKPRSDSNRKRLDAEQLTGTVVTRIASDGRVRSKSAGEPSRPRKSSEQKSSRHHKEHRS
ncbi:hypothetical protein WICPIJ_000141, partial [Wickerhamomyces pijperi]